MGRALEKWTTPKVVLHPGQLSLPTKNRQQKRPGTAAVCRLKNPLLLAGTYGTGFYVLYTGTYTVGAESLCRAESFCRNTCIIYFRHLELR